MLGDLITFQRGHDLPKSKMKGGKYPVVGSNGIIGWHNEYTTDEPGITIGRSGNIGKPFLYKGKSWSHNTTLYVKEYKGVAPLFIYYFLQTLNLANYAGGSAVPTLNRNHIHTLNVHVPISIREQEKIAGILMTFDNRIGINERINDNLQQQAQAVFDQWFGSHFENSTIPIGWEVTNLGDMDVLITDYVANGSFKSLAENVQYLSEETNNVLIRLTDYNNNYNSDMIYISDDAYEFLEKSKLFGGELIISNVGANVGTVFRCPRLNKRMSLAPNAVLLRSKLYEHYLYLLFTSAYGQHLLRSIVTGSAQPKFNKTNFKALKVLVPDKDTLSLFNDIYAPIYEQITLNHMENAQLSNLRDTLLPKLMSGEIDVSSIDI